MFARKKQTTKSPRELFDNIGKTLFELIDQSDLDSILKLMEGNTDSITSILHLYDNNVRSMISAINQQFNPPLAAYFFQLVLNKYNRDRLDKSDEAGYYLYHWALVLNQVNFIKTNFDQDLCHHYKTTPEYSSGDLPSQLVAFHAASESLDYLISRKVDLNAPDAHGSALMHAVRKGHLNIIKRLIQAGVTLRKVGSRFHSSEVALCEAARLGHDDIVVYLIGEYPDQSVHTQDILHSALEAAFSENHVNIIRILLPCLSEINVNQLAKHFSLRVNKHHASRSIACLKILLDLGLDPNFTNDDSLLAQATTVNNLEAVQLLLRSGATPSLEGFLWSQEDKISIEILKEILKTMQNPRPAELEKAVDYAIHRHNMEMLHYLIQYGAKLNGSHLLASVRDEAKLLHTPQLEASLDDDQLFTILVTQFLSHFSNDDIKKAAILALETGNIEKLTKLYALLNPVEINEFARHIPLYPRRTETSQQCLIFLLEHNLDPNENFLLEIAAKVNDLAACEALLERNADANLHERQHALISAVYNRNARLVKLLLDHGAHSEQALNIARSRRYADIAGILEEHMHIVSTSIPSANHYYIHCRILIWHVAMAGIMDTAFTILAEEPKLLERLPSGIQANCSFAKLKDIFQQLYEIDSLNNIVDYGIDKERDRHKELLEFDCYYDCSELDKETVLKAIELLKTNYYRPEIAKAYQQMQDPMQDQKMDFDDALESGEEDGPLPAPAEPDFSIMLFDPAKAITQFLLEASSPILLSFPTSSSLFLPRPRDEEKDSDEESMELDSQDSPRL